MIKRITTIDEVHCVNVVQYSFLGKKCDICKERSKEEMFELICLGMIVYKLYVCQKCADSNYVACEATREMRTRETIKAL